MLSNRSVRLSELAEKWNLTLEGEDREITGVAGLEAATPASLVFVRDKAHLEAAARSGAGAILASPELAPQLPRPVLIAEDPYLAFIRIESAFLESIPVETGHNHAYIHPNARVDETASIGTFVHISEGCIIEEGVRIHPGVKLLENVRIGKHTVLYPNVVVYPGCRIGNDCTIGAGTVIGGDGFGYHFDGNCHHKVPQVGCVVIGNNVEVGTCVSIDRGTFGETRIGNGTKIDNQVQIGHNVTIGNHVIIVAQAGISGSTIVDDYAVLAGKAGLVGHIRIGRGATIGGAAVVTKSVPDGGFVTGYPAIDHRHWKKQMVHLARLPELADQLKKLLKENKNKK